MAEIEQKVYDGWNSVLEAVNFLALFNDFDYTWSDNSDSALEVCYENDIISNIVDLIPDEGCREGFSIEGIESDLEQELLSELDRLQFMRKANDAWKKARIYGFGCLLILSEQNIEKYSQDLDPKRPIIKLESFATEVVPGPIDRDLRSTNFGLPRSYDISGTSSYISFTGIHNSRMLRYEGLPTTKTMFERRGYRGASVINRVRDSVGRYQLSVQAIPGLIHQFQTKILKLGRLVDAMDEKSTEAITSRLKLLQESMAKQNMLFLGQDDEFQNITASLNNLDNVINVVKDQLSASSHIPVNILFGTQEKGLNNDETGPLKKYYQHVHKEQVRVFTPPLRQLIDVLMIQRIGKTVPYRIGHKPLYKESPEVLAKIRKLDSETAEKLIDLEVVTPEEVRKSYFTKGVIPTIEVDHENDR